MAQDIHIKKDINSSFFWFLIIEGALVLFVMINALEYSSLSQGPRVGDYPALFGAIIPIIAPFIASACCFLLALKRQIIYFWIIQSIYVLYMFMFALIIDDSIGILIAAIWIAIHFLFLRTKKDGITAYDALKYNWKYRTEIKYCLKYYLNERDGDAYYHKVSDDDTRAAYDLDIPIDRYLKYKTWYDEHQFLMQQYGIDSKEANDYFASFFKHINYPNEWLKYQQSRYKSISDIIKDKEDRK